MPAKKKKAKPAQKSKPDPKTTPRKAKKPVLSLKRKEAAFPIVGIGASAGGLEAFQKFFDHMPEDSGMAFVLISHLDPNRISMMPELLQKHTEMSVRQAEDGMEIQPNIVYLIPPDKDLAVLDRTLQLIDPILPRGQRSAINYFFISLAQDQGENAIGIVLSGTGTDGTHGIKAIKANLGMAMVQDLQSAKYGGMPGSAIDTGLIDYVLPPEDMPEILCQYTKRPGQKIIPRDPAPDEKVPEAFQKILILIRSHTGHDFSLYKKNTLYRRIERRMDLNHIENISQYVRYLQQNVHEVKTLFKDFLIGVSNFFRDTEAFEALKKALLELLGDKPENYPLRIWVPGCASGEEAYSVAIILRECMDTLGRMFHVQIFATDIDERVINTARAGIFSDNISMEVDPDRLERFFLTQGNAFQIKKEIREMLIFATQSIIKDPPFTKLDLICCRNLLIYLESALQKKLIPLFHYSLRPGGVLFLGTSESIGKFVDLFSVIDKKWRIFRRKDTPLSSNAMLDLPASSRRYGPVETAPSEVPVRQKSFNISHIAEEVLLERYAPPSVIINEKAEVLYFHGRTGKYLEPAAGAAQWKILNMARRGLKMALTAAVREAFLKKTEVIHNGLKVNTNGGFQAINLTVRPISHVEALKGLFMVVFEEAVSPKEASEGTRPAPAKKKDLAIANLKQELKYTRESLQGTIEELETANEELKSTNEEMQSTNEELRSSNEELETSREELQSLNEELVTVNAEFQGKVDDLSRANDDLVNLMNSTQVSTIFLDMDLCVKRFTVNTPPIINLIPTDVGRPIQHIVRNFEYNAFEKDASEVLKTLIPRETEILTHDGCWYVMRLMPYRTTDNVIDGLVITFVDIHEQKDAFERLEELNQEVHNSYLYADNIVQTIREPLVVLDADLRIVSANQSFYSTFDVIPEGTLNCRVYDLGNGQWDIAELRHLLEDILKDNSTIENFKVMHDFEIIGQKIMILNARKIQAPATEKDLILLAIEDVTGR